MKNVDFSDFFTIFILESKNKNFHEALFKVIRKDFYKCSLVISYIYHCLL